MCSNLTTRAVYGRKYKTLNFGGGTEAQGSWGLLVFPDFINLEGALLSEHSFDPNIATPGIPGGITLSVYGMPPGDVTVQIGQPAVGTLTGPSSVNLLEAQGWTRALTNVYRFPALWQGGTGFPDQIHFTAAGGSPAVLNINGFVSGTTGINDYLEIQGPSMISATQGDPNSNCQLGFCPITFSAQLIDYEGNNTYMTSWSWTLELQRQQGFTTVRSYTGTGGSTYSDFHIFDALNISPLANWNRNTSGNIIGKVSVTGIDSDGWPQSASMMVELIDVPLGGRPVLPSLRGRMVNSSVSS